MHVEIYFCLEKIIYFLNFFNSFELLYLKMQEIIKISRKIKKRVKNQGIFYFLIFFEFFYFLNFFNSFELLYLKMQEIIKISRKIKKRVKNQGISYFLIFLNFINYLN